uniref:Uncharacterized protein n=1 Tax=Prymnesium polylepis TaxID=72548 RepID=A0A7S4MUC0_9EUKA
MDLASSPRLIRARMASTSTAATVLDLLQRAQVALNDPSGLLDPTLSFCRTRVDECVAALEGNLPSSSSAAEDAEAQDSTGDDATASTSATQATQTINATLADAVAQANPTQADRGSQVAAQQADATAQATPARALGDRNAALSENRGC